MNTTAAPGRHLLSLLLTAADGDEPDVLRSLRGQSHRSWELVVAVRPEDSAAVAAWASGDQRVRPVSAESVLAEARGSILARVRDDDVLPPRALAAVAAAFADPAVAAVYGDEERLDERGRVAGTLLRPEWSPERLRQQDYVGSPVFVRADVAREVGGYRAAFARVSDYDLLLRVSEQGHVAHAGTALVRRRADDAGAESQDGEAADQSVRAVQEHLDRLQLSAHAVTAGPGRRRMQRRLDPARRVSVVIPTAGTSGLVWGESRVLVVEAVRSLLIRTDHEHLEVVVVVDDGTPASVVTQLQQMAGERLTVVRFHEPFNFGRKINLGALVSRGERLVFLNDDTEMITQSWLDELVAVLDEPDVGVAGARLLYGNRSIQHAGLASVGTGEYLHPFRAAAADDPGERDLLLVSREVSAVTGACLAVRREVFLEVGGLCERLPSSYNDVDFCLKVRAAGYRVVLMRDCELFHFETMTRPARVDRWEVDFVVNRWGRPERDAYTPEFPEARDHERRAASGG